MRQSPVLVVALLIASLGGASEPLKISCQVQVPAVYQHDPPGWQSPTGESEAQRYTSAYEAFWWNCILLKADDLEARCPSMCSGTPAATSGCTDGELQAQHAVSQALRSHSRVDVASHLRTLANDPKAKAKTAPYFPNGPQAERVVK